MAEEILEYQPSKSMAFGHASMPRNPNKAWQAISAFLDKYTVYEEFTDIKLSFNTWRVELDKEIDVQTILMLNQFFGKPNEEFCHLWEIDNSQLEKALQFVFDVNQWPKQKGPPVTLEFHSRFQWKDIKTGQVLAGQKTGHNTKDGELHSYWHFYIDYKLFIQPDLLFPYAYGSIDGMKHLKFIEDSLPFRFSDKHLRRLLPTKAGRYRYLKLPKHQ